MATNRKATQRARRGQPLPQPPSFKYTADGDVLDRLEALCRAARAAVEARKPQATKLVARMRKGLLAIDGADGNDANVRFVLIARLLVAADATDTERALRSVIAYADATLPREWGRKLRTQRDVVLRALSAYRGGSRPKAVLAIGNVLGGRGTDERTAWQSFERWLRKNHG